MVIVRVTGVVKPDHKEDFVQTFAELRPDVLAEKGCRRYEHYLSPEKENVIFIYEEWESREALEAHLKTPHMLKFFKVSASWIESTEMKTFEASEFPL